LKGSPLKGLYTLSMRILSRDGALALKETLEKENIISKLLRPIVYNDIINLGNENLHKLSSMKNILDQHDFEKAIVFVDRVVIAKRLYEEFKDLNPVLILGKIHSTTQQQEDALKEAQKENVKLIISTSAGEEGLDLPSADLLIIWSNTLNIVRFIQRMGRIMRKNKKFPDKPKVVTYIATPDTPDYDALYYGLEAAAKAGVEIPGIDTSSLFKGTLYERVANLLQTNPATIEDISQALNIDIKRAKKWIGEVSNKGRVFYFYLFPFDPIKKACAIKKAIYEKSLDDYIVNDVINFFKKSWLMRDFPYTKFIDWISNEYQNERIALFINYLYNQLTIENRIYSLTIDIPIILMDYSQYFNVPDDFRFSVSYRFSINDKSEYNVNGNVEEIFNILREKVVGKKVYFNFSSYGYYSNCKISYDSVYNEDTLKLVIMNAGWICWSIKNANEIIRDNRSC